MVILFMNFLFLNRISSCLNGIKFLTGQPLIEILFGGGLILLNGLKRRTLVFNNQAEAGSLVVSYNLLLQ